MQRHVEPELLGGLQIDNQLKLGRGLDRKFARFCAPQDAINVDRRAPKIVNKVISVGQQTANLSVETRWINGGKTVTRSQRRDLLSMDRQESTRHHDKPTIRLACIAGDNWF